MSSKNEKKKTLSVFFILPLEKRTICDKLGFMMGALRKGETYGQKKIGRRH
jgi:hypothetical protein